MHSQVFKSMQLVLKGHNLFTVDDIERVVEMPDVFVDTIPELAPGSSGQICQI